jgi:hypothetical protein
MDNERQPLLSDDDLWSDQFGRMSMNADGSGSWEQCASMVRDFYEAKITSGELRVVKGAALVRAAGGAHYTAPAHCSLCGIRTEYYDEDEQSSPIPNFCPGCGAKINA